jgi:hypothetical protein
LRNPQAQNGGLRQFASVTSRSGGGGKSSIRAAVIKFPIFLAVGFTPFSREPDHFPASLEPYGRGRRQKHSDQTVKQLVFRQKITAAWNKTALLLRRHSYGASLFRHCREATKLRPRCLMRVDLVTNGEHS